MKAAVLSEAAGIPRIEEMPDPVPGKDEQLMFVRASAIKNIDRMRALDNHYDHYTKFPVIVGTDAVGVLENGMRVYSGSKNGMMSEKAIVHNKWIVPIPDGLDDIAAAAIPNPAVSAWLSLEWKGQLKNGDAVLILGATGSTGRIAVQLAKHLGAGKVVALGRNQKILDSLYELGADTVISLSQSAVRIQQSIQSELLKQPFHIVLDYLWGEPAEKILDALTGHDLEAAGNPIRWIQIGEMAGPSIRLKASALRSSGIEMHGQGGGAIPGEIMAKIPSYYLPEIFKLAMQGKITIETETVSLKEIEPAWLRENDGNKRIVVRI